jgi:hypothetical protein
VVAVSYGLGGRLVDRGAAQRWGPHDGDGEAGGDRRCAVTGEAILAAVATARHFHDSLWRLVLEAV